MKLFVTVGTSLDPFDRLLRMVDEALRGVEGPVGGLCQYGACHVRPARLEARESIPRAEFEACMRAADVVVCHAGVGALSLALRAGHRPLVVPRLSRLGEIVNNHQLEVSAELSRAGRITLVEDAATLGLWFARAGRGELERHATAGAGSERRLEPVALALAQVARRSPRPHLLGRVVLRQLAALAPPLATLRRR